MLCIVTFYLLFAFLCFPFFHHFLPSSRSYACTRFLRVSICIKLKQRQKNIFFTFTRGTVVTRTCPALNMRFSMANTLSIGARLRDIRRLHRRSNTSMGPARPALHQTPSLVRRSTPCPCKRPRPFLRDQPGCRAPKRLWFLLPLSART